MMLEQPLLYFPTTDLVAFLVHTPCPFPTQEPELQLNCMFLLALTAWSIIPNMDKEPVELSQ